MNIVRQSLFVVFVVAAVSVYPRSTHAGGQDGPKFYPIDEAAQDSSLLRFREKLIRAVKSRDFDFVLGVVDENLYVNYDGPQGKETFKNQFGLADPKSKYWKELEIILSNGGSFEESRDGRRIFWAPYVNSKWPNNRTILDLSKDYKWPDDVFEEMEFGVVLGDSVLLREVPQIDAPAIQVLSYDLVAGPDQVDGGGRLKRYPGWIRIVTYDGHSGFIPRECFRNWFDYSLQFMQIDGKWRIVSFFQGVL